MITSGASRELSASVKSRPCNTGTPIVRKYFRDTIRQSIDTAVSVLAPIASATVRITAALKSGYLDVRRTA